MQSAEDEEIGGSPCCYANVAPRKCHDCAGKGHLRINGRRVACNTCDGEQYVAACVKCDGVVESEHV